MLVTLGAGNPSSSQGTSRIARWFTGAVLLADVWMHLRWGVAGLGEWKWDLPGSRGSLDGDGPALLSLIGLVLCFVWFRFIRAWGTVLVITRVLSLMALAGFWIGLASQSQPADGVILRVGWGVFFVLYMSLIAWLHPGELGADERREVVLGERPATTARGRNQQIDRHGV